jgi:hypothetical protein
MCPPIAAYGYVFVVRGSTPGVIVLASSGPPIASDLDVFGTTAISFTSLV